jgi:hypothetical protein
MTKAVAQAASVGEGWRFGIHQLFAFKVTDSFA